MTTRDVKRKLRAILSADVQGYSRLMGDDEVATVKTITEYRETLASLVNQYNGRVVDSPGDNVLSEFGSVVDAVQCAVEIQNVLKAKNEDLPENRRMVFRIGVNLGDVIQEENRIYGDGVNIAARIESLADGGGICVSGTAYDHIKNKLALGYNFIGEHAVKNISDPVRVYKVPMDPKDVGKKRVGKPRKKIAITVAVILILGAAAAAIWNFYPRPAPTPTEVVSKKTSSPESPDKPAPLPDKPSIAVLPFSNISGDPKEDYLSDGITEQIIMALSKTPRMLVIARNSVFTYKGKPVKVQQVSEELGVRYVLEGSVQKSGDKLRITAQLIDAKTGNHLWSERYDRELKDLFDLQDDITKNVITALQVKLTVGQGASILSKGTKNLEAYLKMMKGRHYHLRFNEDDNETSRRLFEETIALDPNYAIAYVFLAWTYYHEAFFGWNKMLAKSYEKAMELAKKAISLDEQNAGAYMVFANVYAKTGQFEKAAAAQKKALSLDPANSAVNALAGNALYHAGKFKEAIGFFKKAIRINPKHPNWYLLPLGAAYFWTGQNEEAIAAFKKWVSREPKNADAHAFLGISLIAAGKPEAAIAMLEKALTLNPDSPGLYAGNLSVARACTGQSEEAITTMQEVFNSNPKDAESCSYLSVVLTYQGRHEEALAMAKKAVSLGEMSPGPTPDAILYERLGLSYIMMGLYEEAIAAYKKALNLWPEYVYGHIELTASYTLAGRMEEARAEAAEVLRLNPKITLEDIDRNGYCNYKKADKERFMNALRKAGLK
jgi:adenylate cyclase